MSEKLMPAHTSVLRRGGVLTHTLSLSTPAHSHSFSFHTCSHRAATTTSYSWLRLMRVLSVSK